MTAPRSPNAVERRPEGRPPAARTPPLVRLAGAAVALAGGVLTGVLGLILVPLRVDTPVGLVRVPVAVAFVVAANAALSGFARYTTESRWGPLLPAAGWFLIAFAAVSGARANGSLLLLGDDLVGLLTIFGGTATVVVGVMRALARRAGPRPARSDPGGSATGTV